MNSYIQNGGGITMELQGEKNFKPKKKTKQSSTILSREIYFVVDMKINSKQTNKQSEANGLCQSREESNYTNNCFKKMATKRKQFYLILV